MSDAANSAIKGLSEQPMLLLVAVLNVLMIGGLLYVGRAQQEERSALMVGIINNCRHSP